MSTETENTFENKIIRVIHGGTGKIEIIKIAPETMLAKKTATKREHNRAIDLEAFLLKELKKSNTDSVPEFYSSGQTD